MNTTQAIVRYFDPPRVTMPELKALKQALSSAEWDAFGREVCAVLGVEWEPVKLMSARPSTTK